MSLSWWLLLPLGTAHADDARAHFTLQPRVVVDLAHDRPMEDVGEAWTWMRAHATGPAKNGRWFLEVQADYVVLMGLHEDTDLEAATNLWMGESGWAGDLGPVFVRAGHLVERWGAMDLLPVTDTIGARDLRAGPLIPLEHARVPAPMARLEVGEDKLRASVLLLPFGTASRVPLWGTDFSMLRQGMVEGLLADAATWSDDPILAQPYQRIFSGLEDGIAALDAQTRRGLEGALAQTGTPRPLWEAGEVGAEVQSRLGPVDLALTGAWIRRRVPVPQLDPTLAQLVATQTLPAFSDIETALGTVDSSALSSERPRTLTAGLAAQTLVGAHGLRAEANYTHAAVIPMPWFDYAQSPQWTFGAAVDRATSTRFTVLLEGRWRHLTAPPPDALMVGLPDHLEVAGGIRATFARERLSAELGTLVDLTFSEVAAQPSLRYRASDTFDLGAGAVVFASPTPAAVTWTDAMDYNGGLIGYSSDADAIWLDARWLR